MSTLPIDVEDQNEDSSEETMSFLDHLDELRSRLFKASIVIALSLLFVLFFLIVFMHF